VRDTWLKIYNKIPSTPKKQTRRTILLYIKNILCSKEEERYMVYQPPLNKSVITSQMKHQSPAK
jgi:hypothetical protein